MHYYRSVLFSPSHETAEQRLQYRNSGRTFTPPAPQPSSLFSVGSETDQGRSPPAHMWTPRTGAGTRTWTGAGTCRTPSPDSRYGPLWINDELLTWSLQGSHPPLDLGYRIENKASENGSAADKSLIEPLIIHYSAFWWSTFVFNNQYL